MVFGAEVVGVAVMVIVITIRASQKDDVFLQHSTLPAMNSAIGCVLLAITLIFTWPWFLNILKYRRYACSLAMPVKLEAGLVFANGIFDCAMAGVQCLLQLLLDLAWA